MILTQVFKISGMHCSSCAMNIDGELEDTAGIIESSTNYAKQVAEVKYDDEKIQPEKIVEIIKKTGYEVIL